jgi:hypothetical protein
MGTALSFTVILGIYLLLYTQWMQRQKVESLQHNLAQEKELGELKIRLFSMVSHEFPYSFKRNFGILSVTRRDSSRFS